MAALQASTPVRGTPVLRSLWRLVQGFTGWHGSQRALAVGIPFGEAAVAANQPHAQETSEGAQEAMGGLDSNTFMASQRTALSLEQTSMSADTTQMSVLRTSLSLI